MTFEDPVTTIVRLLKDNMHVVKDDESLSKIYVSRNGMIRLYSKIMMGK